MSASEVLYRGPADRIDFQLVRQFVIDAEEANLFIESTTLEAKARRDHNNVVEAVAALSNTDGGVVLVGVLDNGAVGADRIVGVPQVEHDRITSQLNNLISTAMPEVIAVRIPNTERLVIVLRVNADAVPHPVVVAGKVVYRVPGHTIPADRQRIIDLVARDSVAGALGHTTGRMAVPTYPWQPNHIPLWPEDMEPGAEPVRAAGELRVVGGLTLPPRIVDRPWLDTRARRAAEDALNSSPLRSTPFWQLQVYEIREARATTLRIGAERVDIGPAAVESAAYLSLSGRSLSLLFGLRWLRINQDFQPLRLDAFYWALLGSLVAVASTYRHVARALDAAEPSDLRAWEARLDSSTHSAFDVIEISQFPRDNRDKPEGANFPSARTLTTDLADLDQLARNWLTYWLLEIGTRNFERWLADLEIPHWLRVPDVGLPA